LGTWSITETDLWGHEDLDLVGSPEIVFAPDSLGSIRVGALEGQLDYRGGPQGDRDRVDFSWSGFDDMDEVSGRGWAELDSGSLRGKLFIHMGDEVAFAAVYAGKPKGT
jgi:hypothetical protein